MSTTLNAFRTAPQATQQTSTRQRHQLAKAYLRALRLAELREWLATEPQPRIAAGTLRQPNRLARLTLFGLGLLAGVAAAGVAITSTPVVTWLLEFHLF